MPVQGATLVAFQGAKPLARYALASVFGHQKHIWLSYFHNTISNTPKARNAHKWYCSGKFRMLATKPMSSRDKQRGLFNQPEPKGEATPSVRGDYTKPKSRLDLKSIGVLVLALGLIYTTIGETMLPYDWRWSTVTGRRAGNQESEALRTATDAKAIAAGAEEAARVAAQVKGEEQKADIQTRAAGERVFEELPGRAATEVVSKKLEVIASCRDKRRQLADEAAARCMAQPSMSEQACSFPRDEIIASLDQICGKLDDVTSTLEAERGRANAP
jgi:hypothetical protein